MDVGKATAQLRKKFVPVVPSLAEQLSRVETSKATCEEKEKALLFLTTGLDAPRELEPFFKLAGKGRGLVGQVHSYRALRGRSQGPLLGREV